MGISGLLPMLKGVTRDTHVRELQGQRVAVDTYCWLHKGAFSASREICLGIATDRHVDYCMQRVSMLLSHGVTPVLVFDGGPLPSKAIEEERRKTSRDKNLAKAAELEAQGNKAAYDFFQRSVDITPDLAKQLIEVLRGQGVEFVVAPYEADAQMAYLCRTHAVDAVITEDSDLIAYGCPRVLFKMDKFGACCEIRLADIPENRDPSFAGFTPQMVMEMCILSGCDYLPSLPGVGLKKAHGFIQRFKTLQKAVRFLRFNGTKLPPDFETSLARAVWTFKYQRVYDPATRQLVHLEPLPVELVGQELDFLGPCHFLLCTDLPPLIAQGIAEGRLNPLTLEPFPARDGACVSPLASTPGEGSHASKQSGGWQGKGGIQFLERRKRNMSSPLPAQKNKLSKYFVPVSAEAKRQFQVPRTASPAAVSVRTIPAPTLRPPPLSKCLSSPRQAPAFSPNPPAELGGSGGNLGSDLRAFLASLEKQDPPPRPCGPAKAEGAIQQQPGGDEDMCSQQPQPMPAAPGPGKLPAGTGVRAKHLASSPLDGSTSDSRAPKGWQNDSLGTRATGRAADRAARLRSLPEDLDAFAHTSRGDAHKGGQLRPVAGKRSSVGAAQGVFSRLEEEVEGDEADIQAEKDGQERGGGDIGHEGEDGWTKEAQQSGRTSGSVGTRPPDQESGGRSLEQGQAGASESLKGYSPGSDSGGGACGGTELDVERLLQGKEGPSSNGWGYDGEGLALGNEMVDNTAIRRPGRSPGSSWTSLGAGEDWLRGCSPSRGQAVGSRVLSGELFDFDAMPSSPGEWEGHAARDVKQVHTGFSLRDPWGLASELGGVSSVVPTSAPVWPGLTSPATGKKVAEGVDSPLFGLESPSEGLLTRRALQGGALGLHPSSIPSTHGSPVTRRRVLAPLSPNLEAGLGECSVQQSDRLSPPVPESPHHPPMGNSEAWCSKACDDTARQAEHEDPKCAKVFPTVTGGGNSRSQHRGETKEGGLPARLSSSSRFFGPRTHINPRRGAGAGGGAGASNGVTGSAEAPADAGEAGMSEPACDAAASFHRFSHDGTREPRPSSRLGIGLATDLGHVEKFATVGHQALDIFEAKLRSYRHGHS